MAIDYNDLPDDDYEAFLYIEDTLRKQFELEVADTSNSYSYYALDYLNKVLAAAEVLQVSAIIEAASFDLANLSRKSSGDVSAAFEEIRRASDKLRVTVGITQVKRGRQLSVGLKPEQKEKIHAYLNKIRAEIESSDAPLDKREKIFSIIASLAAEIDKLRTRFDRFADLARALAGVSRDVAEEGAEPWWKWVKAIFGVLDASKDQEARLPKPDEIKQITKRDDQSDD